VVKEIKIAWYKRRAKKAYLEYTRICDEYTCGSILTRNISGPAVKQANNFNSAMRNLKMLGEKVPDVKL